MGHYFMDNRFSKSICILAKDKITQEYFKRVGNYVYRESEGDKVWKKQSSVDYERIGYCV